MVKLNTEDKDIQHGVVDKLNSIFVQRYPVYYMKEDAVRFGRSFATLSPAGSQAAALQSYISPNSVRKWRETANENLDVLKKEIDQIPDDVFPEDPIIKDEKKNSKTFKLNLDNLTVTEPSVAPPPFSASINPLQRKQY